MLPCGYVYIMMGSCGLELAELSVSVISGAFPSQLKPGCVKAQASCKCTSRPHNTHSDLNQAPEPFGVPPTVVLLRGGILNN